MGFTNVICYHTVGKMSIMGEMHIVTLLNTIEEINHRADL